tara:strand:- start:1479 stop:1943 length:465 start_codon:yes stop_codon:yes gene_type:complete
MIRYDLICENEHVFEAWFSNSSDYDRQEKDGLLCCAVCATSQVKKAIMAPNVSTSRKKEQRRETEQKALSVMSAEAKKMAEAVKAEIRKNCENVGDKFADEARAMHYGEKESRGIYGKASPREASELAEEGVGIAPLPDACVPEEGKAETKKLN